MSIEIQVLSKTHARVIRTRRSWWPPFKLNTSEAYYSGSGTVWHRYPDGRRAGTSLECLITDAIAGYEFYVPGVPSKAELLEMQQEHDRYLVQSMVDEAKEACPERCPHCHKHVNTATYDFIERCCADCAMDNRAERTT